MTLDNQKQAEKGLSPGQALLVGLAAGGLVIALGYMAAHYLLGAETLEAGHLFWWLPLAGGAAAVTVTAAGTGAGLGRVLGMAAIMVLFGYFVHNIADYYTMWEVIASMVGQEPISNIDVVAQVRERIPLMGTGMVILGAVLGLVFGGRKKVIN